MGGVAIAGLVIAAASAVAETASAVQQSQAQKAQIKNQLVQSRIAASQKSVNTNKKLISTLGLAEAQVASRGISFASGSFKSINDESIQNATEQDNFIKLNQEFVGRQASGEMQQVLLQRDASSFNAVLSAGKVASSVFAL
ncbi:MAG: hypothetical protein ACTSP4_00515 [Candidatus Hodarchaeales archaeon]